jgi:hypothetical protein
VRGQGFSNDNKEQPQRHFRPQPLALLQEMFQPAPALTCRYLTYPKQSSRGEGTLGLIDIPINRQTPAVSVRNSVT